MSAVLTRRCLFQSLGAAMAMRTLWGAREARAPGATAKRVAVLFPSSVEPCATAVEGLRESLTQQASLALLDLNAPDASLAISQELARNPALAVAVGSDAVRAMQQRGFQWKTISTMTLEADQGSLELPNSSRLCASVYLDIPLRTLLVELRKLFPDKTRVGVIRNPSRGDLATAPRRVSAVEGGTVEMADCAAPHELLPVFLSFRKKVDCVICLPDGSLYSGATAKPLILASLENRLPIVGFSPSFVRAGAAVAIYPDYRAIGEQTADLVRRSLEYGECSGREMPRKVTVAINAKVLRLLGIDCHTGDRKDLVIVR